MTAQDYIQSKLDELRIPLNLSHIAEKEVLVDRIYSTLTSKKFRKFSMSDELAEHVRKSIELNVENNNPINITYLNGGYKLWRLEESPETDWAELFALMRYVSWVKGVCEIYEPGVVIDFFMDDYIVPMLNNVDSSDTEAYIESSRKIHAFLKAYTPANLELTIHTVGSLFESREAFEKSVCANLEKIESEQNGTFPHLSESEIATILLNAKPTKEQLADPQWKEKLWNLHNAYSLTKSEPGYHKNRPEKILTFTTSLPMAIGVGTTKKSVMKFWIGAGVLLADGEDYKQDILSPNQLEKAAFDWEEIHIPNLTGKNFNRIRVIK